MAVREEKILLEPMNVSWGRRQKSRVEMGEGDSSDFANKAFKFASAKNETLYYAWFNVDGMGEDPEIEGRTAIEIEVVESDGPAARATKAATALNASDDFNAKADGDDLIFEVVDIGDTEETENEDLPVSVEFETLIEGDGRDLGGTSEVEVSFEIESTEVTASQTGQQVLDRINTASNVQVNFNLLELSVENWREVIGKSIGDIHEVDGEQLVGMGESKRFLNMSQFGREMILSPVGAQDKKRNVHIWKTTPSPESATFSGDDLSQMPINWQTYRDKTKPEKINLFSFGDGTKNLL